MRFIKLSPLAPLGAPSGCDRLDGGSPILFLPATLSKLCATHNHAESGPRREPALTWRGARATRMMEPHMEEWSPTAPEALDPNAYQATIELVPLPGLALTLLALIVSGAARGHVW